MNTDHTVSGSLDATPSVVQIPIEKIIDGVVVEVDTKSIPITPRKVIDPS